MTGRTDAPSRGVSFGLICLLAAAATARADDQPQWGQAWSRNMVSSERGLPASFDPGTGENVKWTVPLGSSSYSTPVVARGRVLLGTNNRRPRDPRHRGDRGVLLCLDEADGKLVWQLVVPKLRVPLADVAGVGLASPATVEAWDSVATVTLFAVIDEEFNVSLFDENVEELVSFQAILDHLYSKLDRAAA